MERDHVVISLEKYDELKKYEQLFNNMVTLRTSYDEDKLVLELQLPEQLMKRYVTTILEEEYPEYEFDSSTNLGSVEIWGAARRKSEPMAPEGSCEETPF